MPSRTRLGRARHATLLLLAGRKATHRRSGTVAAAGTHDECGRVVGWGLVDGSGRADQTSGSCRCLRSGTPARASRPPSALTRSPRSARWNSSLTASRRYWSRSPTLLVVRQESRQRIGGQALASRPSPSDVRVAVRLNSKRHRRDRGLGIELRVRARENACPSQRDAESAPCGR